MLATRPETQISGDWMLVPASRNLHWRHSVLHSAFKLCKQKIAPGESLNENLIQLIEAARKLWERMLKNSVQIDNRKCPINGDMSMLFKADGLTSAEKILLRSYMNVKCQVMECLSTMLMHTCSIAGKTQRVRSKNTNIKERNESYQHQIAAWHDLWG